VSTVVSAALSRRETQALGKALGKEVAEALEELHQRIDETASASRIESVAACRRDAGRLVERRPAKVVKKTEPAPEPAAI